jgi:hypothetical protein
MQKTVQHIYLVKGLCHVMDSFFEVYGTHFNQYFLYMR